MNLILLEPGEVAGGGPVVLGPRQASHVLDILRPKTGDTLRVGVLGGAVGRAEVLEAADGRVVLAPPALDTAPPRPWFDLLLAMPRPKVLRRLWAPMASLGVRRIYLANAAKVERCYFDNHWLSEETYGPLLREGLEQSCTTAPPEVVVVRRFRPFVEDVVPRDHADAPKFVAHPGHGVGAEGEPAHFPCDPPPGAPLPLLAIGPEGGWTDFELELLETAGFRRLSLGPRPLRTGVALCAAAGALMG